MLSFKSSIEESEKIDSSSGKDQQNGESNTFVDNFSNGLLTIADKWIKEQNFETNEHISSRSSFTFRTKEPDNVTHIFNQSKLCNTSESEGCDNNLLEGK